MKYTTQQNKYTVDKLNPIHFVKRFLIQQEVKKKFHSYSSRIRIADLGCGNGLISNELSKFGRVDAFDKDQSSLNIAKINKVSNIKFYCQNIETIRKKNNYDLIVCSEVLIYIKNDNKAIENIYKLLKNNGYLIITVPINKKFCTDFDRREHFIRRYEPYDIISKLNKNGFSIEKLKYWGFPFLNLFYLHFYIPRSKKESFKIHKDYRFPLIILLLLKLIRYLFLVDTFFNNHMSMDLLIVAKKR